MSKRSENTQWEHTWWILCRVWTEKVLWGNIAPIDFGENNLFSFFETICGEKLFVVSVMVSSLRDYKVRHKIPVLNISYFSKRWTMDRKLVRKRYSKHLKKIYGVQHLFLLVTSQFSPR